MRREGARAVHVSEFVSPSVSRAAARKLATLVPAWIGVFFSNTARKRSEGALKLARVAARKRGPADKTRILAIEGSFHGRTLGALSITQPSAITAIRSRH